MFFDISDQKGGERKMSSNKVKAIGLLAAAFMLLVAILLAIL